MTTQVKMGREVVIASASSTLHEEADREDHYDYHHHQFNDSRQCHEGSPCWLIELTSAVLPIMQCLNAVILHPGGG